MAALALVQAWSVIQSDHTQLLRPLVQYSMSIKTSQNDAVVLVAVSTGGNKGLNYLKQNLSTFDFMLQQTSLNGAKFLVEQNEHNLALKLLSSCQLAACNRLTQAVEETIQRESAADLSSYFDI